MKNSRIILPLLAMGVVASFYYAWQNTPRVQHINGGNVSVSAITASPAGKTLEADRIDFSGGEQRKFTKPRRNLFNQLFPAPLAPKPKVTVPPVAPSTPVVVAPAPLPPPMPVPTLISRMPSFLVLGYLEKGDQLTAFLSLQGEIYLVKKDQLFADEFRVVELNQEKITIVRVKGAGEVSLPLSETPGSLGISPGSVTRPALRPAMPLVHPPLDGEN